MPDKRLQQLATLGVEALRHQLEFGHVVGAEAAEAIAQLAPGP